MQEADSVSTAGPPADYMTLSPEFPHQGVWEYMRPIR